MNDSNDNATGWISYHISGKGQRYGPYYLYLPDWTDKDEINAYITNNEENWNIYAEWYKIDIELGVAPPIDILEKKLKETNETIENRKKLYSRLLKQRDEWYGGLIRN